MKTWLIRPQAWLGGNFRTGRHRLFGSLLIGVIKLQRVPNHHMMDFVIIPAVLLRRCSRVRSNAPQAAFFTGVAPRSHDFAVPEVVGAAVLKAQYSGAKNAIAVGLASAIVELSGLKAATDKLFAGRIGITGRKSRDQNPSDGTCEQTKSFDLIHTAASLQF